MLTIILPASQQQARRVLHRLRPAVCNFVAELDGLAAASSPVAIARRTQIFAGVAAFNEAAADAERLPKLSAAVAAVERLGNPPMVPSVLTRSHA